MLGSHKPPLSDNVRANHTESLDYHPNTAVKRHIFCEWYNRRPNGKSGLPYYPMAKGHSSTTVSMGTLRSSKEDSYFSQTGRS